MPGRGLLNRFVCGDVAVVDAPGVALWLVFAKVESALVEWTDNPSDQAAYILSYDFPVNQDGQVCLPISSTKFGSWMWRATNTKSTTYVNNPEVRAALEKRTFKLVLNDWRWKIHPDTPLSGKGNKRVSIEQRIADINAQEFNIIDGRTHLPPISTGPSARRLIDLRDPNQPSKYVSDPREKEALENKGIAMIRLQDGKDNGKEKWKIHPDTPLTSRGGRRRPGTQTAVAAAATRSATAPSVSVPDYSALARSASVYPAFPEENADMALLRSNNPHAYQLIRNSLPSSSTPHGAARR